MAKKSKEKPGAAQREKQKAPDKNKVMQKGNLKGPDRQK